MCVGNQQATPQASSKSYQKNGSYPDEQRDKCREAAKSRRSKESELFQELESLLPLQEKNHLKEESHMDKTSIIRLAISYIKSRKVVDEGFFKNVATEENYPSVDILSCLGGFSLVLGPAGEVVFVSNNIHTCLGLGSFDLLGHPFSSFVHPCDHEQLQLLTQEKGEELEHKVEISVRVKCTVTERGRQVNLKQAGYKSVKISGKTQGKKAAKVGGLTWPLFRGIARVVGSVGGEMQQVGVFSTKHEMDMKFVEADAWLSTVAGYSPDQLAGTSYYSLVHGQDSKMVQECLAGWLGTHLVCETSPYRLLCATGGLVWVQTTARVVRARQGRRRVVCRHSQISEVLNKEDVLTVAQMENKCKTKINKTSFRTDLERSLFTTKNVRKLSFPIIIDKRHNIEEIGKVPKILVQVCAGYQSMTKAAPQDTTLQYSGLGNSVISSQPVQCNQARYLAPNAVTSNLFGVALDISSLKTSNTDKCQGKNIQETSENQHFDSIKRTTDMDDYDFFTKLAESLNLNQLSPHSGFGNIIFEKSDSASNHLEMFNEEFNFPNLTPNRNITRSVSSNSDITLAEDLTRVGHQRKCSKDLVRGGDFYGTFIDMDQRKLYTDLDNLLVEERIIFPDNETWKELKESLMKTEKINRGDIGKNTQRKYMSNDYVFPEDPIRANLEKYDLISTNQSNTKMEIYDWRGPLRVNTKCTTGRKRKYSESSTEVGEILKHNKHNST